MLGIERKFLTANICFLHTKIDFHPNNAKQYIIFQGQIQGAGQTPGEFGKKKTFGDKHWKKSNN